MRGGGRKNNKNNKIIIKKNKKTVNIHKRQTRKPFVVGWRERAGWNHHRPALYLATMSISCIRKRTNIIGHYYIWALAVSSLSLSPPPLFSCLFYYMRHDRCQRGDITPILWYLCWIKRARERDTGEHSLRCINYFLMYSSLRWDDGGQGFRLKESSGQQLCI